MSLTVLQGCNPQTSSLYFSKAGAHITHNAAKLLIDITGGHLLDDMQLPLEPKKASYHFFNIWSSTHYCKHTLMGQICGV